MAVNGKKKDQYDKMINTPIPKLLIQLSIPAVISMLVTNIYNLVDTAFVGELGNSASGAVGIVLGFMAILQAIAFMFGQGSGSIISRKLGAKDISGASVVASTGFFTALFVSILVGVFCLIFLDPLVMMLGSTETIAPYAKTYIFFILLSAPFLVTSFTLNNILRYEGKALLGMIGMMSGAILNIAGDAILMKGMGLGIAGAGISTAVSQVVSFSILISMFLRHKVSCRISLKLCQWKPRLIWQIFSTGCPSLMRQGLHSIATVLLNSCAAVYGDYAVAGMSIASRVLFFVMAISVGIGQGFQPISGFSYGAGRYDRLKKSVLVAMGYSAAILYILIVITYINGESLVWLFRDDAQVVSVGTRALRLQLLSAVVMPVSMILEMMFQSTGQRVRSIILSGMRNGFLFIPFLLVLASVRGLAGIQEAQACANVFAAIPSAILGLLFLRSLGNNKAKNNSKME